MKYYFSVFIAVFFLTLPSLAQDLQVCNVDDQECIEKNGPNY